MTDGEYQEFLAFLYDRYVRHRLPRLRRSYERHMIEECMYHLDQAQRAIHVTRFIEAYCEDDTEIYRTFTHARLTRVVSETYSSLAFGNRVIEEAGFLDAFEAHADDILSGLDVQHLPEAEREIMRNTGSSDPDAELRSLVLSAKALRYKLRRSYREASIRQRLKQAEELTKEATTQFEIRVQVQGEMATEDRPVKSRKWFKGVGQIAQGATLSIADVALAAGALNFPVSPETQTWGAVVSVATGIATIINGVGDLMGE